MKKIIFSILVLILLGIGLMSYESITKDSNGETIIFNNDLSQVAHYDMDDTITLYGVTFKIDNYQVTNDEYRFYFETPLTQDDVSLFEEKGLMIRTGNSDRLTDQHIGDFTKQYLEIKKRLLSNEVSSFNQICVANYDKEMIELVINIKD